MGKRGQKRPNKKPEASSEVENDVESISDSLSALFRPIPPIKRNELNGVVDKLLHLASNFTDEPTTPSKLYEEFEKIYELVLRIRELEECNMSRKVSGPRKAYVKYFKDWLDNHGAKIEGVEIADFGTQGLGLRVTKDLERGSLVLSIPRKVCMTTETAHDSSLGTLMERDPMLRQMPNVALALHLVLEKNSPASFWEPYINLLPRTYNTVLYYTPDDFKELRGSPSFEDAIKQFKYISRQYAYFYKKFESMILRDYFTFEEYRWAVSTVMTRQNQVPASSDVEKSITALIPFWDMANHDNGELSTDFDPDGERTLCMAHKDFKAGDQFTIFYGTRTNVDLLVHNGFVFGANECDCLTLRLGISKNDSLAAEKYALLDRLNIPRTGIFYAARHNDKPVETMVLAFLRVITMKTKDELDKWANMDKEDTGIVVQLLSEETLDKELDSRAFQYLETRCSLLLKSYPTTLAEDQQILSKENNSQILVDALTLRMKEKVMLDLTIKYCQTKLQELNQEK